MFLALLKWRYCIRPIGRPSSEGAPAWSPIHAASRRLRARLVATRTGDAASIEPRTRGCPRRGVTTRGRILDGP